MSKIDEQIQQLFLKKKKIDFLNHILDSAKKYDHKDYKEVKDDVISILDGFIQSSIESIESDKEIAKSSIESQVSEEDYQILKTMIDKVKSKKSKPKDSPYEKSKEVKDNKQYTQPQDKLSFAMDNRHLANKEVSVANDQNMIIKGKVVGLDAPHVVVKTEAGPTINVPLDKISLL